MFEQNKRDDSEEDSNNQREEDENNQEIMNNKEIEHTRRYPTRERKQTRFYTPGEGSPEIASVAYTEPRSYDEVFTSSDKNMWKIAMDKEYKTLIEKNTWELCYLPKGTTAIESKWF